MIKETKMSLKNKIELSLCIFKNGKYKILSQKLRVIDKDLMENIISNTGFLDSHTPKLADRIRYILAGVIEPNSCKNCKKQILDINRIFCSAKCNNNSEQTKSKFRETYKNLAEEDKEIRNNKRKETVDKKYGGYTLQSLELRDKMRSTMISKYGVEHSFQNENSRQKALNTWIKKYSADNPFKAYSIKEKIKNVLMDKYGVNNAFNVNLEKTIDKIKKTKIERGWIIPDEFLSDYKIYRKTVKRLTEITYKKHKNIINPNNLERVTNGKIGFQLDHMYSIVEGFLNNVEPDIISHYFNLQMLECSINRKKSKKCDIDLIDLISKIKKYE